MKYYVFKLTSKCERCNNTLQKMKKNAWKLLVRAFNFPIKIQISNTFQSNILINGQKLKIFNTKEFV